LLAFDDMPGANSHLVDARMIPKRVTIVLKNTNAENLLLGHEGYDLS
jgi:hypothetical protein